MDVIMVTDLSLEQPCMSFYDTSNGVLLKSIKNNSCSHNGYGFIGNEMVLSAQHNKQLIHVYDIHKEQMIKKIVCPGKVSCLAVSPDNNYCVVALVEKIYIWQVSTGCLINILSKHYQSINIIKFTQDGSSFITSGDDNLVLVWNFASALQPNDALNPDNTDDKPIHTLSQHSLPVKDIHVGVSGKRCHIATVSLDQTCNIYNLSCGQLLCRVVLDTGCTAVTMNLMEQQAFVGAANGRIYLINCYEKKVNNEINIAGDSSNFIQAHNKQVNAVSVSKDATMLLSASMDCMVKLWHISSRQCLRTFELKGEVSNATFLRYPPFLQNNYKPPKVTHQIKNFKRTLIVPSEQQTDFTTMKCDSDNLVPVMLRDIHDSPCCLWNQSDETALSTYDQLKLEYMMSKLPSSNVDFIHTATRSELIQKINELQTVANEFYNLAKTKLLNDADSEMHTQMHDNESQLNNT